MTSTLYHFTRHEALGEMLKDDMINLTLALGSSSDYKLNKDKFYFLSMQTSRNGGYGLKKELPVMLVMDGSKLNHNFKGGPVDYWQTQGSHQVKHNMDEFEERLVTDKQEIEMSKYVTEIHVWLNRLNDDEMYKIIGYAKKQADELDVPIYFYDDKNAYFNNVKSKAIDVDTDLDDPEKPWSRGGSSTDVLGVIAGGDKTVQEDLAGRIAFNKFKANGKSKAEQIKGWTEFFTEFSDKWRLKYAEDWVKENPGSDKNSPYDFKIADMYSSVEAEIHNHRSSKDKFTKWIFNILIKDMKQLKAKSFKEYMTIKYGKFR